MKNVIYEPSGAAREYAELATNPYLQCPHGCRYCYAPGVLHVSRQDFLTAIPELRPGYPDNLKHSLEKYKADGLTERVHIGFTCDLFSNPRAAHRILQCFADAGVPFTTLTKAAVTSNLLDAYKGLGTFGVSLVWSDDKKRSYWEPFSASMGDRWANMEACRARGIPTWVSIEPVIEPEEALGAIDWAYAAGAEEVRIGKANHVSTWDVSQDRRDELARVDWAQFAEAALERITELNEDGDHHMHWLFKKGLAELLPGNERG